MWLVVSLSIAMHFVFDSKKVNFSLYSCMIYLTTYGVHKFKNNLYIFTKWRFILFCGQHSGHRSTTFTSGPRYLLLAFLYISTNFLFKQKFFFCFWVGLYSYFLLCTYVFLYNILVFIKYVCGQKFVGFFNFLFFKQKSTLFRLLLYMLIWWYLGRLISGCFLYF